VLKKPLTGALNIGALLVRVDQAEAPLMKNVSARSPPTLQLDDGTLVPEELIGRLRHASETTIIDLVERYTPRERVNLAMFCYPRLICEVSASRSRQRAIFHLSRITYFDVLASTPIDGQRV
jgi:hypothetical protein